MNAAVPPSGTQPPLDLPPGGASGVSAQIYVHRAGDTCWYFLGGLPFDSHHAEDAVGRNVVLGRVCTLKLASASELAAVHGISRRTVSRAAKRWSEEGARGFYERAARTGRPLAVQDPQVLQQAADLLRAGTSLRRTARETGMNYQTLRNYLAAGRLPGIVPDAAAETPGSDAGRAAQGAGPERPTPAAAEPQGTDTGGHEPPDAEPETPEAEGLQAAGPAAESTPPEAADEPRSAPAEAVPPARTEGLDKQRRNIRDAQAPQGRATCDSQGRAQASMGALLEREPRFEEPVPTVTGGGLLAALPALLQEGLLDAARHLSLPKGFYGVRSILLTVAFMLLAGTRNPERLRYLQPGEMGALLGLDRCPCPRTLRRRLKALAQDRAALAEFRDTLALRWIENSLEPGGATLLVDGHAQAYGGKGRLQKQFFSREQACRPGAAATWASALGGAPLLCLHDDLNTALSHKIRALLPDLERLGLLPDRGASPDQPGRRLTLVFDRGGWDHKLFRELDELGVSFVVWRKGAQLQAWPQEEFREVSCPVHVPLGQTTLHARCAERRVTPDGRDASDEGVSAEQCWLREIRFIEDSRTPMPGRNGQPRRPRPSAAPREGQRQPALVTNDTELAPEALLGRLRSRWSQEILFKYLRANFGLDTLPEYGLEELDPDTRVVNPEWRRADNLARRFRARRGQLLERLERGRHTPDEQGKLQQEADLLEHALNGVEDSRGRTPRHVRAGELPEELRYQILPKALRGLLDSLRMLAYRAEVRLAFQVAPHLSKPQRAHQVIRESLFASEASLVPDHEAGVLRVPLLRQSLQSLDEALQPLLEALTATRTVYPGTQLRLVYEFADC